MKKIKFIVNTLIENHLKHNGNDVWYHGTNKEFTTPKLTVGEFGNLGGFFLTKNINFAKSWGNFIKTYKLSSDIKIFDVTNEDDLLLYAKEVYNKNKIPNLNVYHYAVLLDAINTSIDGISYIMQKAYPEIDDQDNIFNIIMSENGNKYDTIQYIIRKKRLYRDYMSIEENDKTIKDAGFDAAFVYENNNRNLQVYNLSKIRELP